MEYKKANIEDLQLILRMEEDFRKDFLKEEYTKRFLENKMNLLFVGINNNRIIGFAYGYELNRLNTIENMVYIHEVGVLPDFQQKGIGTELMENLKIYCKNNRIYKIFLITQKSNTAACALYKKTGGKIIEGLKDNDRTYIFKI